ncbi:MAG TPA: cellulase family glycosylhydrolase [Pyrinomonadaceae bacterium]|nr:cellulase family glycosylhydrolase [Pyrinomonadaceae bacterium]
MRLSSTDKLNLLYLALALAVGAAIFLTVRDPKSARRVFPRGFVSTSGTRFVADGAPLRFVGANVAVMYRDEDRALMPETLRHAAQLGVKVVRVWANGEGAPEDGITSVGADREDWPPAHRFRRAPGVWNEEAFAHLDRVLAEAARNRLRVQLTLSNWWRDTGGVTQYLRWAGVPEAADERYPYGVNAERAMEFYSNDVTRRLYREHVEKIVSRRNTVTGALYRDDPTIFSYELMNEAQAPTGRWAERRAWVAEMSAFVKSLDPDHMVVSGSWAYRSALERLAWLEEQRLPTLDYCDVHNYPRDDQDSFVTSPTALAEFVDNRAAAAYSINKPLVVGEFGMSPDGFVGATQAEWFRALFDATRRASVSGAMFWILTPDPRRGYGVTYTTTRDDDLRAEIARGAQQLAARAEAEPPAELLRAGHHLIPRQFAFERAAGDPLALPKTEFVKAGGDAKGAAGAGSGAGGANGAPNSNDPRGAKGAPQLYRFAPEWAARGRFEKIGGGEGYVWGTGVGSFEYVVPARGGWRRIGEINVRAHLQPVVPPDALGRLRTTRVTLYIGDTDCGSRLVAYEEPPAAIITEWRVTSLAPRVSATRDRPLAIRFVVEVDAEQAFGINISNFPAGFDAGDRMPVEVELR